MPSEGNNTAEESGPAGLIRPRWGAVATIFVLVIPLRLIALDAYPHHFADEGSWPYAVRYWVENDFRTFDYYMAPAYHWVLGVPFRFLDATMSVARLSSATIAYVGLLFFYGLARRTYQNERTALLALALLATCFGAILWDRRALIEPYQLTCIFATIFFFLGHKKWELIALVLAMTGVVLTKATGAYIVGPLFAASLFATNGTLRDRRTAKWAAMLAGIGVGAGILWLLAQLDPEEAAKGWGKDLVDPGIAQDANIYFHYGRFGLDPQAIYQRVMGITRDAPLLCALAVFAGSRWLTDRKYALATWWCLASVAVIFLQAYVLQNHIAIVYPAFVLASAGVLADLRADTPSGNILGFRVKWPDIAAGLIIVYSVVRVLAGAGGEIPPSRDAIQWMAEHVQPDERVAAAPYVLMQVDAEPFDHNAFAPEYLPSKALLLEHGIDWVVFDEYQWVAHCVERAGLDPEEAIRTMKSYGTVEFEEPLETYVIRISPDTSPAE